MDVILFASISCVIVTLVIVNKFTPLFTLKRMNAIQVLLLSHVATQFIPSVLFYLDYTDKKFTALYLISCALLTIVIPIGAYFAGLLNPLNERAKTFRMRPVLPMVQDQQRFLLFFMIFYAICALIFVSYVARTPSFPLLQLLSQTTAHEDLVLLRREVSTYGILYGSALRVTMPVFFLTCLVSLSIYKPISMKAICLAGIMIAFLYNAWPGSKTPVATLFLLVTVLLVLRSRELPAAIYHKKDLSSMKRIWHKKSKGLRLGIILTFAFVIGYPFLIFIFLPAGQNGIGYIFESIFTRIFLKPAENTYVAFELYNNSNFTNFGDINVISDLFDVPYVSLSMEVAVHRGLGEFTNAPPATIGRFFAQGGMTVVALMGAFSGFLFRYIENVLLNSTYKTPLTLSVYAVVIFGAFRYSWGNFYSLLYSELFIPIFIILFIAAIFSGRFVNANSRLKLSQ